MCNLCPRQCNVNRKNDEKGYCEMGEEIAVAKIMLHKWEEPFISGIEYGAKGTGAIFFYGCNLSCIYCQNYKISNAYKIYNTKNYPNNKNINSGKIDKQCISNIKEDDKIFNCNVIYKNIDYLNYKNFDIKNIDKICSLNTKNDANKLNCDISCKNISYSNCNNLNMQKANNGDYKIYNVDELSDEMVRLQNEGAYTISLITANVFVDKIAEAIKLAKIKGVNIPFVYNTSGYDSIYSLKKLEGLIDIYMPDFKYYDDEIAYKYSDVKNYVEVTKNAIDEMYNQVGNINVYDVDDLSKVKKGINVRHLVLPGHIEDSKKIIKYLYEKYANNIYISIMNQYTPPKDLQIRLNYRNMLLNNKDKKNLSRILTNEEYDDVVNFALSIGVENAFIQEEGTNKESYIPDF